MDGRYNRDDASSARPRRRRFVEKYSFFLSRSDFSATKFGEKAKMTQGRVSCSYITHCNRRGLLHL